MSAAAGRERAGDCVGENSRSAGKGVEVLAPVKVEGVAGVVIVRGGRRRGTRAEAFLGTARDTRPPPRAKLHLELVHRVLALHNYM